MKNQIVAFLESVGCSGIEINKFENYFEYVCPNGSIGSLFYDEESGEFIEVVDGVDTDIIHPNWESVVEAWEEFAQPKDELYDEYAADLMAELVS